MAKSHAVYRVLVHRLHIDPDDLDVFLRVLVKQQTPKSAYDPRKAGVGKYLFTTTKSALLNILRDAETAGRGGTGGIHGREVGDDLALAAAAEDDVDCQVWDLVDGFDDAELEPVPIVAPLVRKGPVRVVRRSRP